MLEYYCVLLLLYTDDQQSGNTSFPYAQDSKVLICFHTLLPKTIFLLSYLAVFYILLSQAQSSRSN